MYTIVTRSVFVSDCVPLRHVLSQQCTADAHGLSPFRPRDMSVWDAWSRSAGAVAALPAGGPMASWRTPQQPVMPLGASSPNAGGGYGLGWPRAPTSPLKSASPPPAQIIGTRRRRRSETPGGGSDEDAMDTGAGPSGGGGKRARREIKPLRASTPGRTPQPDASTDVDIGKMLGAGASSLFSD